MINYNIGKLLGFTVGRGESPQTVGGMGITNCYRRSVTMTINGKVLENVPVWWVVEGSHVVSGLLGMLGVYRHFIITIDETDKLITFTLKKKKNNSQKKEQ